MPPADAHDRIWYLAASGLRSARSKRQNEMSFVACYTINTIISRDERKTDFL
jgi:hypothetical protein